MAGRLTKRAALAEFGPFQTIPVGSCFSPRRAEYSGLPSLCVLPLQTQTRIESPDNRPRGGSTCARSAFLSVRDVAAYLGVSYSSVSVAIKDGLLPAHRFGPRGGTYRIAADDLVTYVEACRTGQRSDRRSENRRTGSKFMKLDAARLLDAGGARAWCRIVPRSDRNGFLCANQVSGV